MNLEDRLDKIREGFAKQAPPEALEVIHESTENLRDSGIMDRVVKEGTTAPPFELDNPSGGRVSLVSLTARGPAVLTFFRGHW